MPSYLFRDIDIRRHGNLAALCRHVQNQACHFSFSGHGDTHLPELPPGLQHLALWDFGALQALPDHLPQGLQVLMLRNCTALTRLPASLPSALQRIDLRGCHALPATPALLAQLRALRVSGVDVEPPAGFPALDAPPAFGAAVREVYDSASRPPPDPATLETIESRLADMGEGHNGVATLIARNLGERTPERGGRAAIAHDMATTLDALFRTHEHTLEWVRHEAAQTPSGFCVNQPVGTWSRIAAGLHAIEQAMGAPDPAAATEAARSLMAAEEVQAVVAGQLAEFRRPPPPVARTPASTTEPARSSETPLLEVEAEVANQMWCKVAENLARHGGPRLAGAPRGVAYAGTVASFLTPERILEATQAARRALDPRQAPLADVARWACESSYGPIWQAVVRAHLPEQARRIDDASVARLDALPANADPLAGIQVQIARAEAYREAWVEAVTGCTPGHWRHAMATHPSPAPGADTRASQPGLS